MWSVTSAELMGYPSFTLLERNVTDGYPVASDDGLGAPTKFLM